jgi:hypothetical protein
MSLPVYGLTPQEQHYILTHPHHAFAIKSSKDKAFEETKKRFGFNGRNDRSDAFRHCFWSAVLVGEIGYLDALQFTTAHESSPLNSKDEKDMDLHNNAAGLLIGRTGGSQSDEALSQRCMAALLSGQLKVLGQ